MYSLSETVFTARNLLNICSHFGMNTLAPVEAENANLQITAPGTFMHLNELQTSVENQFNQKSMGSENACLHYFLTQALLDWGMVQSEAGYSEDLTYSCQSKSQMHLPRLGFSPAQEQNPNTSLQKLAFEIRSLLGDRDWLIYWGKDANKTYLLAVFPSGWNWTPFNWQLSSNLPFSRIVAPLSTYIVQSALDEWRERLSPERLDAEESDYNWFEVLAGQFIHAPKNFNQILLGTSQPGMNFASLLSKSSLLPLKTKKTRQKIWETFLIPHSKLEGYLNQWQELIRLSLPGYLEITQVISPWCRWLDQQNVLNTYLQTLPNKTALIEIKLQALKEQVSRMTEHQDGTEPGIRDILRNPEFKTNWQLFLSDFGHLSPSALDLSHPRFQEQPEQLLRQLKFEWQEHQRSDDWQIKHWLFLPIWKMISRLLLCQEELLSDALWALDQIRQRILTHGNELSEQNLINTQEDLWCLLPAEIAAMQEIKKSQSLMIEKRRILQQNWQSTWTDDTMHQTPDKSKQDICGLKFGLAQGTIWWYQPGQTLLPENCPEEDIILVIQNIDTGWIPFVKRCQGVILTTGGPFDPAALLLRQLGVPSLICHNHDLIPATNTEVRLNSDTGNLTIINPID